MLQLRLRCPVVLHIAGWTSGQVVRFSPWRSPVRARLPQPAARQTAHFVKEVIPETSSTPVTAAGLLTEAGEVIVSGIGIVWDIITANPVLTLFVGAAILSLGFRFFRKAKSAAR